MHLDITKIGEAEVDFDPSLDLSDLTDDANRSLDVRDVSLSGVAVRGVEGVDLRAALGATVSLQCVRCLERFSHSVSSRFSLILVSKPIEFGPGETEITVEDTALFHCPEGKADLRAVASEQLYLALPLKPICREDCEGLCPTCGANRNRIECACRRETVDPRLASLRALKERMDKE